MLDCLLLEPSHGVLEPGCGQAWDTALLTHHAGPGTVTSVEFDPALAGPAEQRLREAGLDARVVVGDGAMGWPDSAPYERVIATCAMERIPWAWVEQTVPGGRIVPRGAGSGTSPSRSPTTASPRRAGCRASAS